MAQATDKKKIMTLDSQPQAQSGGHSGGHSGKNWIYRAPGEVERIEAFFNGAAYSSHSHDTYAIGLTLSGKQGFNYRGASRYNEPGRCLILHPDELHDGQAGTEFGMLYRVGYVDPVAIQNVLGGKSLPFIEDGISDDPRLYQAVLGLLGEIDHELAGLEYQDAIYDLASTMDLVSGQNNRSRKTHDYRAAELAREYIAANLNQSISMDTLEQISGRDRWKLSRDFRALFGTSPYRYLVMRRVELARHMMLAGVTPVDAAMACCFSDQSHMNRHFKKTYGLTPNQFLCTVQSNKRK